MHYGNLYARVRGPVINLPRVIRDADTRRADISRASNGRPPRLGRPFERARTNRESDEISRNIPVSRRNLLNSRGRAQLLSTFATRRSSRTSAAPLTTTRRFDFSIGQLLG